MTNEPADLDHLFSVPLDQFVQERNALARRLRSEGESESAEEVSAVRKPTISAWLVNQVARTHGDDMKHLTEAGETMEDVQRRALSGEAGVNFEAARRMEDEAVSRLRAAALEVLPHASAATLERVTSTFRAGARSTEARATIRNARLVTDLDPVGFDAFSRFTPAAPPTSDKAAEDASIHDLRERKKAADTSARATSAEADRADRSEREAIRKLEDAKKIAEKAGAEARSARRKADEAQALVERLASELNERRT